MRVSTLHEIASKGMPTSLDDMICFHFNDMLLFVVCHFMIQKFINSINLHVKERGIKRKGRKNQVSNPKKANNRKRKGA